MGIHFAQPEEGFESNRIERYVIAIFPVFAAIAAAPHPRFRFAWFCVSFWQGIAFTAFFVQGYGLF